MQPEALSQKLFKATKRKPLVESRHMQLIHNLATKRYGWFNSVTGEVVAWYEDRAAAERVFSL